MCRWVHKSLPATSIFPSPTKQPTIPPTLTNDPEILEGSPRLSSAVRPGGRGVSALSFLRAAWEHHRLLPKPDAGNHQQILAGSEARFRLMTCPGWDRAPSHKAEAPSTCPGSGLLFRLSRVLEVPAASTVAQEGNTAFSFVSHFYTWF